jgi:hypothetical protein
MAKKKYSKTLEPLLIQECIGRGHTAILTNASGFDLLLKDDSLVKQVINFGRIYDKPDGLICQTALAVRLTRLNEFERQLKHDKYVPDFYEPWTAYIFLNDLARLNDAKPGGWAFYADDTKDLDARVTMYMDWVFRVTAYSDFFESMSTTADFVHAVEVRKLPFVGSRDTYIAALVSESRLSDAKKIAQKCRDYYFGVINDRGLAPVPEEYAYYDRVLSLNE